MKINFDTRRLGTETVVHRHMNRRRPRTVAVKIQHHAVINTGKTYPMNGARECARRVRQAEKLASHGRA